MDMWRLLGIEPTSDPVAIRKAYARRLKETRPDEDPDGFQALLAARDRALAAARDGLVDERDETDEPYWDMPHPVSVEAVARQGQVVTALDEPPLPGAPATPPPIADDPLPSAREPSPPALGPRIVEVGALDAGQADWDEADLLVRSMPNVSPRDKAEAAAVAAWLDRVDLLPLEPRREVEAALLRELASTWRGSDGSLDDARIAAARETLVLAAPVFGWPHEERVLRDAFPPHEAALVAQVLRGILPPDPADPGVVMVRTGRRTRLPLRSADAEAFLACSPHALVAYELLRVRAPLPRRLDLFALLAPAFWATQNRRWGTALATLAGLGTAALLALLVADETGPAAVGLGILSVGLFVAVCVTTSLRADRILVAAAARAAARADRRRLFAPAARRDWLERKGRRLRWYVWLPLYYAAGSVYLVPYVTLALVVVRAGEALIAWLSPAA